MVSCIHLSLAMCVCVFFRSACASDDANAHDYRAQLCDRAAAVLNRSLPLKDGLSGARLTFATGEWLPVFLQRDPVTGAMWGLEVDMLNELSRCAHFTYDLQFQFMSADNTTVWSDILFEFLPRYDMVTWSYWTISVKRMSEGAFSPYGFFDASFVLATTRPDDSLDAEVFQFAAPFSSSVWIMMALSLVATGVFFWFLESGRNDADFDDSDADRPCSWQAVCQSMSKSFLQLTGAGGFHPTSWAGKVLLVSWSWCILLLVSSYTANLASTLLAKIENPIQFTNIAQAVAQKRRLCLNPSGVEEEWFRQRYPDYNYIEEVNDPLELASGLLEKKCDASLLRNDLVKEFRRDPDVKNRCDLEVVGLSESTLRGGYMIFNDYQQKCTTLVRDVLNFHFTDMAADGTLEKLQSLAVQAGGPACPHDKEDDPRAPTTQLDISSMSGIFIVHGAGCVLALVVFCIARCRAEYQLNSNGGYREHVRRAPRFSADLSECLPARELGEQSNQIEASADVPNIIGVGSTRLDEV